MNRAAWEKNKEAQKKSEDKIKRNQQRKNQSNQRKKNTTKNLSKEELDNYMKDFLETQTKLVEDIAKETEEGEMKFFRGGTLTPTKKEVKNYANYSKKLEQSNMTEGEKIEKKKEFIEGNMGKKARELNERRKKGAKKKKKKGLMDKLFG